jgi:hypothetical protein
MEGNFHMRGRCNHKRYEDSFRLLEREGFDQLYIDELEGRLIYSAFLQSLVAICPLSPAWMTL